MVNAILILLLFSILVPLFIFLAFSSFKIEGHFYIMWASAVGLLIFPIMALSSIPRNGVYVIGDEDFAIHFQDVDWSIPLDQIRSARVLETNELQGNCRMGGSSFFYKSYGSRDLIQIWVGLHEHLGPVMMCAIKGQRCVALNLIGENSMLIISPESPERFLEDLRQRGITTA